MSDKTDKKLSKKEKENMEREKRRKEREKRKQKEDNKQKQKENKQKEGILKPKNPRKKKPSKQQQDVESSDDSEDSDILPIVPGIIDPKAKQDPPATDTHPKPLKPPATDANPNPLKPPATDINPKPLIPPVTDTNPKQIIPPASDGHGSKPGTTERKDDSGREEKEKEKIQTGEMAYEMVRMFRDQMNDMQRTINKCKPDIAVERRHKEMIEALQTQGETSKIRWPGDKFDGNPIKIKALYEQIESFDKRYPKVPEGKKLHKIVDYALSDDVRSI